MVFLKSFRRFRLFFTLIVFSINAHAIPWGGGVSSVSPPTSLSVPTSSNSPSHRLTVVERTGIFAERYEFQVNNGLNASWVAPQIVEDSRVKGSYTVSNAANGQWTYRAKACRGTSCSVWAYSGKISISILTAPPSIDQGTNFSIETEQEVSKVFVLSATDIDSANLLWGNYTSPTHGEITGFGYGKSRTFTYTPDNGYSGNDSFKIKVSDGGTDDVITINAVIQPLTRKIIYIHTDLLGSPVAETNEIDGGN
jgi:hypothetical protein